MSNLSALNALVSLLRIRQRQERIPKYNMSTSGGTKIEPPKDTPYGEYATSTETAPVAVAIPSN